MRNSDKRLLVILNILNYPCKNPSNAGHNIPTTVWQSRVLTEMCEKKLWMKKGIWGQTQSHEMRQRNQRTREHLLSYLAKFRI